MDELIPEPAQLETGARWIFTFFGQYYTDYAIALWFLFGSIFMGIFVLLLAKILSPSEPNPDKQSTYECSEPTIGSAWIKFNIRYYYFALLFLIFSVEVIFFYPWATVFKTLKTPHFDEFGNLVALGFPIFGEMIVFLFLLVLGYVYAWRKGFLTWD